MVRQTQTFAEGAFVNKTQFVCRGKLFILKLRMKIFLELVGRGV